MDATAVAVAMIHALIPLGLRAVEDALQAELLALTGVRYARGDGAAGLVRWGAQPGAVYVADQKLAAIHPGEGARVAARARAPARRRPLALGGALKGPRRTPPDSARTARPAGPDRLRSASSLLPASLGHSVVHSRADHRERNTKISASRYAITHCFLMS